MDTDVLTGRPPCEEEISDAPISQETPKIVYKLPEARREARNRSPLSDLSKNQLHPSLDLELPASSDNGEIINVCCLSHVACGTLLW